ncbi:MAG: diacylglycerol kinase family lipid kinase [Thermoplasmatales archaeon]|nr:diacylglycerol kinase family lipid kinase [Thermoplasmatales archaeon]
MRILFLVNPKAGDGKAEKEWPKIMDVVRSSFSEFDVEFTQRPLHATELARNAVLKGYDIIVSCGGDGTLNEVINGVAGSDVKICLLPLGTGSDFGKTVGIRSIDDAMKALKGNRSEAVDITRVTFDETGQGRLFINVLEIGFGAEVMRYVNTHSKHGRSSFILGILSTVWKLKRFKPGSDQDDMKGVETIEVIVANGRYFGGGMLASPDSSVNDGILDVHTLKPVSRFTTIFRLRDLMNGSYIGKNYSFEGKTKSARFTEKGNLVEVDGEVIGNTPITVNILQKQLHFLVP